MKLHAQAPTALNTVTGYGPGYIDVNRIRHAGALLLVPDAPATPWQADAPHTLQAEHFAAVLAFQPELVLIGTGSAQRFLPMPVLLPLVQAGIGFEIMDTAAACRTFNILVAEGRRVVGAFLAPGAEPASGAAHG